MRSTGSAVQRGFEEDWLGDTFSKAVLLGNGLVAIVAGLLANTLVDTWSLGPVAPFDAAIVVLLIGGAVISATWPENYGDRSHGQGHGVVDQFRAAVKCISGDIRVLLLGVMQVCTLLHVASKGLFALTGSTVSVI